MQALRSQHPAKPSGFVVRRIVGEGDLWVTEYVITYIAMRAHHQAIEHYGLIDDFRTAARVGGGWLCVLALPVTISPRWGCWSTTGD